jgi:very-short-patch-repair endonuclease
MAGMLGYWYRLYHNMTPSEVALEPAIAALGERYRSQHPFLKHKLFADFALLDRKLIIEVDGSSHDTPKQKYKDALHELALHKDGWRVVRCTNEEAQSDPTGTVTRLLAVTEFPTNEELEAKLACLPKPVPLVRRPRTQLNRTSTRSAKAQ